MKIIDDFIRAVEFHLINPGESFLLGLLGVLLAIASSGIILVSFIKLLTGI